MRKSTTTPDFIMPYSDLMQLGDTAVSLLDRDIAVLSAYGVDANFRTFLINKTQELKDFPSDIELEGAVIIATETKDTAAETLKVVVRAVMVRVKTGFGDGSGKFRRFGTIGMNAMNDNKLLQLGKRIVRVATLYLAQLAPKGLTAAIINALHTIVISFDTAIDAQDDAIRVRDIATEDRVTIGNLLYNKIVELYAFGKDYWISRDEARYNDYVIYDTPSGGGSVTYNYTTPVPPLPLVGETVTGSIGGFTAQVSAIDGSTITVINATGAFVAGEMLTGTAGGRVSVS